MLSETKKTQNPSNWAYKKMLHGKPVNTLHLISMYNRRMEEEKLTLIESMCAASNQIAVSSSILTRRQRDKYSGNRIANGRNTFYMFPSMMCPADIGCMVDIRSGKKVYK